MHVPLTWSVEDVKDFDEVTTWIPDHDDPNGRYKAGDRLWHPVTETLVLLTLGTGIGRIKESNADEVYARIRLIETLHGAMLIRAVDENGERPEGDAAFITKDEVLAHVGLSTNASYTDESRAKFLKRQAGDFLDEQRGFFKRHVEKLAAETEAAVQEERHEMAENDGFPAARPRLPLDPRGK
jgi:hypothetical protein